MTKKPAQAESKLISLVLHTKGQRDRLMTANRHQSDDIFALTAALREAYAILRSKSSGLTDAERVDTASRHIASVIGRYGASLPASANAKPHPCDESHADAGSR